ncbi:hypothetical protein [Methanoregula sp.]|jgi:hypothetical protein|uniref:hypothetical protein n=1 Tax=Methanoregula sp. TaxID=2052170 RepID=UPI0035672F7B
MMEIEQAIRTLEDLRRNDPVIQRGRNAELTTAFKVFWDSNPDESKFCRLTAGLLITPAILYYMATHPIKSTTAQPVEVVPAKEKAAPEENPQQQGGKKNATRK